MEAVILDPNELLRLAQDTTEAGRYQLANAVSQFFDTPKLSDSEQRLAGEVMLSLIRQAEVDLREALAVRLSVQNNIPPEVIIFLANDTISVAKHVLQHSPVLQDIDLIHIIALKGEEHWRSIAGRGCLSPVVADKLIDTGDSEAALNLIDNQSITLQKNCLKKLVKFSLKSEKLQTSLLRRPEIDGDLAIDLYMCVSHALRQEITERFKVPAEMIETSLDNLVEELSFEAKGAQHIPPEMVALSKRFRERDEISPELMIKTLRKGQISFFISLFAEKVGLTPEAVIRLLRKEGGRHFALACRSIGMIKSEFASVFLLSHGIRNGEKVVNQRELITALNYYDSIREFDIHRVMKSWIKNPEMI
jgi:uncharacterized protein (DUF2336 family)